MEEARKARFDEIDSQLRWDQYGSDQEYWKAIEEALPDPEERSEYLRRGLYLSLPHLANPSNILTPARFVEIADSINFFSKTERDELLPGLTWAYRPWIPLGYENTTLYRLLPSVLNLTPQNEKFPLGDYYLLDPAFLGVNTSVQPPKPSLPLNRRAINLSEESTQSVESDDMEAPGFVFHELGVLQSLECETADKMPTTLEQCDKCEGDWEPTGFSVVARLGSFGHIDGVYVIYNMNPVVEGTQKREQVTHGDWGIPPSSPNEQFSCARIGTHMRDFGFKYELAWNDQTRHPVELVWAVRSPMGGGMRITVDSNYKKQV